MDLESLLAERMTSTTETGLFSEGETGQSQKTSETALSVDSWGMHRAEQLAAEQWNEDTQHDALTLADCHTALFEPEPQPAENCADKAKAQWFRELMETPEYHSLHNQTMLDDCMAELGTKSIADQFRAYADKEEENREKNGEPQEGDGPGEENEPISNQLARMRSVAKATQQAQEEINDAQDAAAGLGMGEPGAPLDSKQLANAFKALRDNRTLREIMKQAGRYRCFARAQQRKKTQHGMDDMVCVILDGELSRLLPSELAALELPELELDTLRRIAERQALCREHRGTEKVSQGPIVVYVDESGSMNGENIIQAKALALTLGWIAQQQKRWIMFVGFSCGPTGNAIAFPPGKWNQAALLEWLTHFYSGGTDLTNLTETLPAEYWTAYSVPKGKTDIIVITDGCMSATDQQTQSFNQWRKQEKAKVYSIIIGAGNAGGLTDLSDRTWIVSGLDMDTDAVGEVLSI
jgi:uncharacterized protein with von Willebrand factor type A (vWA) domain